MKKRKNIALVLILVAVMLLGVLSACGAKKTGAFPAQDITLVTYSSVGGGGDLASRKLSEIIKQDKLTNVNVIVENIPGASCITGIENVATAKADGYRLLFVTLNLITAPWSQDRPDLSATDKFRSVICFSREPSFVITRSDDERFSTFEELVAYCKEHPGEISWAGTGAADQSVINSIEQACGISVNYVQYDGGSDTTVALAGGHIDVISNSPGETISYVETGRIKYIAVASDERYDDFPDIPTTTELGYDVINGDTWRGICAPIETPDEVVDYLHTMFKNAMQTKGWLDYLEINGMEDNYKTAADFDAFLGKINGFYKEWYGF